MAFPFIAITAVAQLVAAVADGVPNIDYEKGCRASAAANASLGVVIDDLSAISRRLSPIR